MDVLPVGPAALVLQHPGACRMDEERVIPGANRFAKTACSRERGGTGLGLAIVKHIVNRHQGKLVIDSKAGEGSTFRILIPQAKKMT